MDYPRDLIMGIGVDIEDIDRFEQLDREKDIQTLEKIYTKDELTYCFAAAIPAQHLAARYSGKEAIIKALYTLGRTDVSYREIEILNDKSGIPGAHIRKAGFDDFHILLSLSHSKDTAIAFTIITKPAP